MVETKIQNINALILCQFLLSELDVNHYIHNIFILNGTREDTLCNCVTVAIFIFECQAEKNEERKTDKIWYNMNPIWY